MVSFDLKELKAKGVCQIICIFRGVGRTRVTYTGYVHYKSLYLGLGPQGAPRILIQDLIKNINQSTQFINEQLYINYLTIMGTYLIHMHSTGVLRPLYRPL
jgi:hypothetical protein